MCYKNANREELPEGIDLVVILANKKKMVAYRDGDRVVDHLGFYWPLSQVVFFANVQNLPVNFESARDERVRNAQR